MEFTFSKLKQKDVINLGDGKNLGRVCDLTFTFPENDVTGITVTGGKGFRFTRQDVFIPIKNVEKIGEDAVLVNISHDKPPQHDKCPPNNGRPPKPRDDCPPDYCRPQRRNDCPPECSHDNRRSYDEYE